MEEWKAKGAVLNGYLKFIKKKWGTQGMESALIYADIQTKPKDGEWFSMKKTDKVLEWIANKKGMTYVREAGKYTAKDMGIFRYIFASIVGIENLLKRARENYGLVFNFGKMEIELGEKTAVITIKGVRLTEYSCPAWEGALQGLMEVTKSHGTVKPLEPDNPEDCKFFMRWD